MKIQNLNKDEALVNETCNINDDGNSNSYVNIKTYEKLTGNHAKKDMKKEKEE